MRESFGIIYIIKIISISLFLTACGGETSQTPEIEEQPSQPQGDPLIIPPIYTDSELLALTDNILKDVTIVEERSAITQDNTVKILHAYERSFEVVTQAVMKLLTYPDTQHAFMFQSNYYWENRLDENSRTEVFEVDCDDEGSAIIDFMANFQGISISHDLCLDIFKGKIYNGNEVIRVTYEDDEIIKFEIVYANFSSQPPETETVSEVIDGNFQLTISKSTRKLEKILADFSVNYPDIGLVKFNDFQIVTDSWSQINQFNYKNLKSIDGSIEVEGLGSFNLKTVHAFDESITIPGLRFQFSGSTDSLAHLDVTDSYDYTFGFDVDGDSNNDFSTIFELYPSSTYYEYYYYDLDIRDDNVTNPLLIEDNLKTYTVIAGVQDELAFYISAYGVIGTPFTFDMSNFFRGVSGKLFTYEINAYPIRARDVKRFPKITTSHYTDNIDSAFSFTQVEPGVIEFNVTSPFEEITYNVEVFPIGESGERIGETVTVRVIVNNDNDNDGIIDDRDDDDDNDGVFDSSDAFILDPSEQQDTDGDYVGDNEDLDDDNDGYLDTEDVAPFDPLCGLDVQGIDGECALRNILRSDGFVSPNGIYYYFTSRASLMRWDVKTEEFLTPVSVNREEVLTSPTFNIENQESYYVYIPEQNRLYRTYYDSGIISMLDFSQAELIEVVFYVDTNETVGEIYDFNDSVIVYRESEEVEVEFPETPNLGERITSITHNLINLNGEITDVRIQVYNWYNDLEKYTRFDSAPYCPYGFTFDSETLKFYDMALDYTWHENPCYVTEDEVSGRYVFASPDNSRAFLATSGGDLLDSSGNVLTTDFDVNFIDNLNLVWNTEDFYLYADNIIKRYDYEGALLDQMTLPLNEDINQFYMYGHGGEYLVIHAWGFEYSLMYSYKADE